MNNNDNEILFKIKHKHIDSPNKKSALEIKNKENNISYNYISNYLVRNNKSDIARMLEKDDNQKSFFITKDINSDSHKKNNEEISKIKEPQIKQNNAYLNLSRELLSFNRKINKVLLDLHNIQEDLNKKKINESCSFEIKQNSVGDDEFYINDNLVSEDHFMKQLMQYKKR